MKDAKKKTTGKALAPVKAKPPAIRQDPLDRETAITAALEANGLKVKTKSRTFAAVDRLIGNIIDIPSTFIEPGLDRRRDENNIQRELRQIEAEQAVAKARALPEGGDAYLERYRREQIDQDRNKLEIAAKAVEELKALPAPSEDAEARPMDADWLNEYVEIAGRKSEADIQTLWGKLLAGEIRRPGTFNLRTLQRLSAIDSSDASMIHTFLLHSLNNETVFRDLSNDYLPTSLSAAIDMEDMGIVSSSGGQLNSIFKMKSGDINNFILADRVIKITCKSDFQLELPVCTFFVRKSNVVINNF